MKHCTILIVLAATLVNGTLRAQVPQLVNYQGRVAVNGVGFDGTGQFKFALVNADGSVTYWSNNGTSNGGSEPSAAVPLTVTQGLYSLLLGDTALGANMTDIPSAVFNNPDVRLRVWFDDGVHGSQLLTPDQRLAPATYLADGTVTSASVSDAAITAGKIGPGAIDGTNIAPASLDSSIFAVPGPPSDGQVLGYNNGGLTWTAPGGGVFSLNGTSAYYNGGSVGLGTSSPQAGLRLDVLGLTRLSPGGSGGAIQFGTPNTETGMTIFGTNRADIRFDGSTLKLVAGAGTGVPSSFNGITINTSGYVGIGTANPSGKLDIQGTGLTSVNLESNNHQLFLNLISGAVGGQLKYWSLQSGAFGNGIYNAFAITEGNSQRLTIATGGNVGIGTDTAAHRLAVFGGPTWTSAGWGGAIELQNGAAIGWRANSGGQRFGMGHTNSGFGLFRTSSDPGTTGSAPTYDVFVNDSGNVGVGTTSPNSQLEVKGVLICSLNPNQGAFGTLQAYGSAQPPTNAAYFGGNIQVTGSISKGGGSFKIDHPLDPTNKYLSHSFVESPDMMNIYNGNVVLDASGQAKVSLPVWFGALNKEFRYQLTAIGAPGPNLYIAEEIANNTFVIAGGGPGQKVSWQVTGIRQDVWANAHRIPVEEDKKAEERGAYLHPEEFGQPVEKGVEHARQAEMLRKSKEEEAAKLRLAKQTK